MDNQWFDNPKFRELCMQNNIEPVITGEDRLVLICPKLPDKQTASAFAEMIPKGMAWDFAEGLSTMTISAIKMMLAMYRVPMVAFKFSGDGKVVLMTPPLKASTATQSGSPLWDLIVGVLQRDPFTQAYEIRVGCCEENPEGEVYRNSDGYAKSDPSNSDGVPEENEVEGPAHQESPLLAAAKRVPVPKITDDRFDYDKDFLPKDVGTDVKILLESCNSVEEFLKNI